MNASYGKWLNGFSLPTPVIGHIIFPTRLLKFNLKKGGRKAEDTTSYNKEYLKYLLLGTNLCINVNILEVIDDLKKSQNNTELVVDIIVLNVVNTAHSSSRRQRHSLWFGVTATESIRSIVQ